VPEDATEKTPTRGGSADKTPQRSLPLSSGHSEERTPLRDDTLFDEERERSDTPTTEQQDTPTAEQQDTPTAEQQDTPRVEKTDRAPDTPPRVEKIDSATAHEELNTVEHLKRLEEDQTEPSAIAAKEADFDLPCPTPAVEEPTVSLEPSLSGSVLEDAQAQNLASTTSSDLASTTSDSASTTSDLASTTRNLASTTTSDLAALYLPPPPADGDFAYRQCLTSDEFEASPPFFPVSNFDLGD
jgi:hypothetical protein